MTLQEYTTEELKAELKRRYDLNKAEKNKTKRCRMCKHCREINYLVLLLIIKLYLVLENVVNFLKLTLLNIIKLIFHHK